MNKNNTPSTLSAASKALWKRLLSEFELTDQAGLKLLEVCLLALDRAEACRVVIDAEGLQVLDRFNQRKSHPLLSAERDARSAFIQGVKALGLDIGVIEEGRR